MGSRFWTWDCCTKFLLRKGLGHRPMQNGGEGSCLGHRDEIGKTPKWDSLNPVHGGLHLGWPFRIILHWEAEVCCWIWAYLTRSHIFYETGISINEVLLRVTLGQYSLQSGNQFFIFLEIWKCTTVGPRDAPPHNFCSVLCEQPTNARWTGKNCEWQQLQRQTAINHRRWLIQNLVYGIIVGMNKKWLRKRLEIRLMCKNQLNF